MFVPKTQAFLYQHVFKPVAFRFDPELVHERMTKLGVWMGNRSSGRALAQTLWNYQHPCLEQTLCGIIFRNPVGLTAGFDKDGHLTQILPSIGFGFAEIGSVTGDVCAGNAKPRLWRVPEQKSLLVYYGLKNDGCQTVFERLHKQRFEIPIGVSIAKTNSLETCQVDRAIADYLKAFKTMEPVASYLTLNISCPNTFGGEPFTKPSLLHLLLDQLDSVPTRKPVFLKMPADLSFKEVEDLVEVMLSHRVHGIIFTNLTKQRVPGVSYPSACGGLSGAPVAQRSTELIRHLYHHVGTRFILIGTGGIFSAEDAYEKIRAGASLVQLATGMIYQGPQLIGQINAGLTQLIERDGFRAVAEAVGKS